MYRFTVVSFTIIVDLEFMCSKTLIPIFALGPKFNFIISTRMGVFYVLFSKLLEERKLVIYSKFYFTFIKTIIISIRLETSSADNWLGSQASATWAGVSD